MKELIADLVSAATDPSDDLATAALHIARLEYRGLDPAPYLERLDGMGAAAAGRLVQAAREGPPLARVMAFNQYLFEDQRFVGNRAQYDDPRNSFLNEVLERRTGIPITLAVVFLEVARRAGLPASGVNFPGHFLLRCHAGGDGPEADVILDPFHGGALLSEADCRRLFLEYAGEASAFDRAALAPATKRQIVVRMLVNLKRLYVRLRSFRQARAVTEALLALDGASLTDLRDRGLLSYHLEEFAAALRDLEAYLHRLPQEPESDELAGLREGQEQIWEHVKALRRRVASLN